MKSLKKVLALMLAMIMCLSMSGMAVFAAEPAKISVTGVTSGDTVKFYQVLKFDSNAAATGGWVNAEGFGLTEAQIKQIVGKDVPQGTTPGITSELAGIIANFVNTGVSGTKPAAKTVTADANGASYTIDTAAKEGLYVALIVSTDPKYVYNPVFVAASLDKDGSKAISESLDYADSAMAKKVEVPLDKTANDDNTVDAQNNNYNHKSETVNVGDVVDFKVETKIPEFADNYTQAAFEIQDTLTAGLQNLNAARNGDATDADNTIVVKVDGTAIAKSNYTVTANKSGYTISFKTAYLLGLDKNADVEVTYKAKVTTAAAATSTNQEVNTVVLRFSNDPTNTTSRAKMIDRTNHYTFNIDGNLLGQTGEPWKTTEVIKVGLDKDGNEITTTQTTLHPGQTKVGALEGAKFKIYVADSESTTKIKDETGAEINVREYNNGVLTADKYIVSDAQGRLTINGESTPGIRGLDAGTYYLVETEAPAGFIKAQNGAKIEIIPTFEEKTETYVDGDTTLTVKAKELVSYVVKMNNVATASYTLTNAADGTATSSDKGDNVTGKDEAGFITNTTPSDAPATYGKIINTQGAELPSTGGVGTTLFYIIGAILVITAGVVLVSRRRMSA